MKIHTINHHGSFQHQIPQSELSDADVVLMWNDFSFIPQVNYLKSVGKKVVVFEHGRNALWDYYLNDHTPLADAYLAWGQSGRDAMEEVGVDPNKILVIGNPVYDNIRQKRLKKKDGLKVLYVAMHWMRDVTVYNDTYTRYLIKALKPQDSLTIKAMQKSGVNIPQNVDTWITDVDNPQSMKEIVNHIKEFDCVVTPKESTFALAARFAGIPVVGLDVTDYQLDGDPMNYNRIWGEVCSLDGISSALDKVRNKEVYMPTKQEIEYECMRPSLSVDNILDWLADV